DLHSFPTRRSSDLHPEDLQLAAVRAKDAQEQADQVCLPAPVGAEEAGDSGLQLKAHIAEGEHTAKPALNVVGRCDRRHCRGSLARRGTIDCLLCLMTFDRGLRRSPPTTRARPSTRRPSACRRCWTWPSPN